MSHDIVLPKLFVSCPNLLKSYRGLCILFCSKKFQLSDHVCMCTHCTVMKWFHYISGCEIVVYSCSPMAVVLLLHC